MTTMIVEVYEALRAIDVPDEHAKAAARALTADVTSEVRSLRQEIEALRKETDANIGALRKETDANIGALRKETAAEFVAVRRDIAQIRTEIAVLRWMTGTSLALSITILVKLFLP